MIHRRTLVLASSGLPLTLVGCGTCLLIAASQLSGWHAPRARAGAAGVAWGAGLVVVIAPSDFLFDKSLSNIEQVVARGGKVILISDEEGCRRAGKNAAHTICIPKVDPFVAPILSAIPIQLLAYHTAVLKGTDVDQPRNLAKSVTVE